MDCALYGKAVTHAARASRTALYGKAGSRNLGEPLPAVSARPRKHLFPDFRGNLQKFIAVAFGH